MVSGIFQKRVYRCRIRDVDYLKERLIAEWRRFDQNIIDRAVNQWLERLCGCVSENGGHFQHQIWTIRLFNLTAAVFVNRMFGRFYLEFDFWQTLRCILQKLYTIVWNSCGYFYVKLYLIRWSFPRGIAKSLGGSLFSGHSVYSCIVGPISVGATAQPVKRKWVCHSAYHTRFSTRVDLNWLLSCSLAGLSALTAAAVSK